MITPQQASQVADALVAQQRLQSAAQQNARTPRGSLIYRCPEMASLAPRQQAALLHCAKSIVRREWMIHVTALVLFASLPLVWWVSNGVIKLSVPVVAILALAAVAVNVLHVLIVRLAVRILAGQHAHTVPPERDQA